MAKGHYERHYKKCSICKKKVVVSEFEYEYMQDLEHICKKCLNGLGFGRG